MELRLKDSEEVYTICVIALLQVSREERKEMNTMFNNVSIDHTEVTCNRTVYLTVKSQVDAQVIIHGQNTASPGTTRENGVANADSTTPAARVAAPCLTSLTQEVVFTLLLVLLVALLVVTCTLLICTHRRLRKSG